MAKKGKCPEFENHERWLVSYADMLTLLFAVFVVLFALKEGGEPQVQRTAGSMQESFNTPLDDIPLDRRVGPTEQGFGVFEHFRGNQARPPLIQKFPSQDANPRIVQEEMDTLKAQLEERLYGPSRFVPKEATGHARIVDVFRTAKGFKLRLMARHFYEPGETGVRKSARKDLDTVVNLIKDLGRNVTIEGHTDSMAHEAGQRKHDNWEISALRATSLVKYMIKEHDFPQSRVSAAGYGDAQPIAHNGTAAGRRLNRRIEVHVDYADGKATDPVTP